MRKPRVGLFFIGAERFIRIGEGTAKGNYQERKVLEARQMAEDAQQHFEVVFPGVIYTANDTRRAIDQFFAEKVDCVLAIFLSWADDFTWNRFLRDMPPVPVLFAHKARDEARLGDTHDESEFCEFLSMGGLVGTLEASGDSARYQRPMMEYAIGSWTQVLDRAVSFANAARARALMKDAEIGLLPSYNEVMWSTYVDPYRVFKQVGPEIHFLSVSELMEETNAIPEEECEAVVQRLEQRYEVLPDVDRTKFAASVRATMGMEKLAHKRGVSLIVLNDIDKVLLRELGLRPGFYPTSSEVDTVIVPEGDIGSGLAAYMLKLLTSKPVHYIEPFHIDLPSDTFEGGHAGPNDYTHPDGHTKVARDVRFAKMPYRHAGAPFAWHVFPEGRKTMLHLSQHNDHFVMTVTLVDSLACEPHLASYSHGRFKPVGQSCTELFEKLMRIGVTQHYLLVEGDVTQDVLDLGRLLGFECHKV